MFVRVCVYLRLELHVPVYTEIDFFFFLTGTEAASTNNSVNGKKKRNKTKKKKQPSSSSAGGSSNSTHSGKRGSPEGPAPAPSDNHDAWSSGEELEFHDAQSELPGESCDYHVIFFGTNSLGALTHF